MCVFNMKLYIEIPKRLKQKKNKKQYQYIKLRLLIFDRK